MKWGERMAANEGEVYIEKGQDKQNEVMKKERQEPYVE